MQLEKFSGPGSTPKRRKFWNQVADAVIASQKIEGKNVSVDVREGYGSVINVNPQRQTIPTTCPPPNPCTLDFSVSTPSGAGHWSTTQTGLDMYIGDCQDTSGVGWHANNWAACDDPICGGTNSGCEDGGNCVCAWWGRWRDSSFGQVQIKLVFVQGDSTYTPDGWWLLVGVGDTALSCFWGNCPNYYWLGSDASIFETDFNISLDLPFSSGSGCPAGTTSFDITFHPCT